VNINYWKPTPKKWRKVGDTLLLISVSFTGLSIVDEMRWLGLAVSMCAAAGKFLTNFFADEN